MLAGQAVLVLADVPHLEPGQIEAIDRFVAAGGGLLIAAGERTAEQKAHFKRSALSGREGLAAGPARGNRLRPGWNVARAALLSASCPRIGLRIRPRR